jgi:hypothetical protein
MASGSKQYRDHATREREAKAETESNKQYRDHATRELEAEAELSAEEIRVEAKRLAEGQGLKWNELSKEKRRAFKAQIRRARALTS